MKRLVLILALLYFTAFGSGLLERLHNLELEREDARAAAPGDGHSQPGPRPEHNESNCVTHARLHTSLLTAPPTLLLLFFGLLVFVALARTPSLIPRLIVDAPACRGPPSA